MADYDIITVGGGLGGAALGKAMAERGYKVLIAERETQFKDRVRGEYMFPWGVAEAKELGLYDAMKSAGGQELPKMAARAGPAVLPVRDLETESALGLPAFGIYHPAMQEAVIAAAAAAGAEVRRGVKVSKVIPGNPPAVEIESDGGTEKLTARLVVGADGRNSVARKQGGFEEQEHQTDNLLAGVLMEGVNCPEDAAHAVFNPFMGQVAFIFPQGGGKARAYFGCRDAAGIRLQGDADFGRLVELSVQTGGEADWYERAKQIGPVATFAGNDSWVEHPYKDGIALLGDAAHTSDQTWGQGLSLTLRGARLLRDALTSTDDWEAAGHKYADEANWCFQQIKTVEEWQTTILMDQGPEATAVRMQVLPRMATDPELLPDTHFVGPELAPVDEAARRKLFGE
jgi:2-polyprenyl-6-methoxyphenol hydroxylase-like FAD-dependent oxidoreductase